MVLQLTESKERICARCGRHITDKTIRIEFFRPLDHDKHNNYSGYTIDMDIPYCDKCENKGSMRLLFIDLFRVYPLKGGLLALLLLTGILMIVISEWEFASGDFTLSHDYVYWERVSFIGLGTISVCFYILFVAYISYASNQRFFSRGSLRRYEPARYLVKTQWYEDLRIEPSYLLKFDMDSF